MARGSFVRLNYFVCVTILSRICCAPKDAASIGLKTRSKFLGIIGDSACGTLVLTPWINRAPPVALSGVVVDSHMNEMRMS